MLRKCSMRSKLQELELSNSNNLILLRLLFWMSHMKIMKTLLNKKSSNINTECAMMTNKPLKEDKVEF